MTSKLNYWLEYSYELYPFPNLSQISQIESQVSQSTKIVFLCLKFSQGNFFIVNPSSIHHSPHTVNESHKKILVTIGVLCLLPFSTTEKTSIWDNIKDQTIKYKQFLQLKLCAT